MVGNPDGAFEQEMANRVGIGVVSQSQCHSGGLSHKPRLVLNISTSLSILWRQIMDYLGQSGVMRESSDSSIR